MKRLKRLIESGTDAELLDYIKNDFYEKIDKYLELSSEALEIKKKYINLAELSAQRDQKINELNRRADSLLSELRHEAFKEG